MGGFPTDSGHGRHGCEVGQVSKDDTTQGPGYTGKRLFRHIPRVFDTIHTLRMRGYWVFWVFTNLKKLTKTSTVTTRNS